MEHSIDAVDALRAHSDKFRATLLQIRSKDGSFPWYPYDSMSNIQHLTELLPVDIVDHFVNPSAAWRVLDIGAADGDLGYFFESRGCQVDFLDNPSTNANNCEGIKAIAKELNSSSRLIIQDIDRNSFSLDGQYNFAIALGLLYHLRNPMGFLITLAEHAERMVLSTRVANHLPNGMSIEDSSVGYLLRCRESNNDPTNYWMMSPLGLETMLKRCGWNVITKRLMGAEVSNPVDNEADQRMFVYCERVDNWMDLGKHHDF
jgi:tRNA (mo5U34)-methyltransferase